MRREHKPPTAISSGKSRSVASYATERRSLEHDSNHTTHCHHATKLATKLATLLATTYQFAATICSHRSQSLRAHRAERQMSASAAVARWAWDQRKGGLACAWRLSELGAVCRVRNHDAYRLSVSPSTDLCGALHADPCQSSVPCAIQVAFGWVPSDDARLGTHLISTGVGCRRQRCEGYAQIRPDAIAEVGKYFLLRPLPK